MATIKSLALTNFVDYSSLFINFDEHCTYLVGPNGAGKTTAASTGIWFVLQGIAEKSSNGNIPLLGERFRFIGDNGKTAMGEIVLQDAKWKSDIRVTRKLTKSGSSEVTFTGPAGMELNQEWLNDLFNVFMIAPKRFIELSPREQAIQLGIDTKAKFDDPIAELKIKFTAINKELAAFDNLEIVEPVEPVEIQLLLDKKELIKKSLLEKYNANKAINKTTRLEWEAAKKEIDVYVKEWNDQQEKTEQRLNILNVAITTLRNDGYDCSDIDKYFNDIIEQQFPFIYAENLYPDEPTDLQLLPEDHIPEAGQKVYIRELPDEAELQAIDLEIVEAGKTNEKAQKYTEYLQKLQNKAAKQKELNDNKTAQRDMEAEKVEYIKGFKLPFSKLSIGDDGSLLLDEKPMKPPYFSTGELIRYIPTLIASQKPELKYIFLQDFNLLDEEVQQKVEKDLVAKGFQLVIEYVGTQKVMDKNCILLKDSAIVSE